MRLRKGKLPDLVDLGKDSSLIYQLDESEIRFLRKAAEGIQTPVDRVGLDTRAMPPIQFFREILGWKPSLSALKYGMTSPVTEDQARIAQSVARHPRTVVTAGVGTGKTFVLGGLALWYWRVFGPDARPLSM